MVQLQVVPDDRRERARDRKRRRFLAAAGRVIDERGLAGLTMQAVAEELDCAVGTIYTYFDSKAALLAALQAEAVETLVASYRTAAASWDPVLDEGEGLDPGLRALVHLQAFGAFFCAASVVLADEFHLQRLLLSERPPGSSAVDQRRPMAVLERLFEIPRSLVDAAVACDVLEPGDTLERVVRWLAALDGVLLLDALAGVDRHLFRGQHHGRALTADLLVGWGADRADVEVAASHVDRLAAVGPLAPPPHGPGYE
ncbi:helix-turn-helix domain-containing protein [Rhabdothermincola sediminis]|uniref:helix-turn-helix domain-containing protein n=1 Tax=Rhabdothermincola sediminis TaxID=2751370 RepID=UPI001AA01721|nr:TetR/AcrR family transcriptional regulator [Rhabdothermincola sediminis]